MQYNEQKRFVYGALRTEFMCIKLGKKIMYGVKISKVLVYCYSLS